MMSVVLRPERWGARRISPPYSETTARSGRSSRRYWALELVSKQETSLSGGVGPEVRLVTKLGDSSLNAYKERAIDWDEKTDGGVFPAAGCLDKCKSAKP